MTDNEILARWQGWKVKVIKPDIIQYPIMFPDQWVMYNDEGEQQPLPDYPNDEAACGSLLDTLVEKGYEYSLFGNQRIMNNVDFRIYKDDVGVCMSIKSARREAIIAACLEVARKEVNNG